MVRNFSVTKINYAGGKCNCCNKFNSLSGNDRKKLKEYNEEYASNNPVPIIREIDVIKNEKPVNIAAAFLGNPEGLKKKEYRIFRINLII